MRFNVTFDVRREPDPGKDLQQALSTGLASFLGAAMAHLLNKKKNRPSMFSTPPIVEPECACGHVHTDPDLQAGGLGMNAQTLVNQYLDTMPYYVMTDLLERWLQSHPDDLADLRQHLDDLAHDAGEPDADVPPPADEPDLDVS